MLRLLRNFALTALGFLLLLIAFNRYFSPGLDSQVPDYDAEAVEAAEVARALDFDPDSRYRINQEVDYREGAAAAWYPREEPPILRELVEEGFLPPLEERVGSQPLVMEGPDGVGNYGGTWYRAAQSKRNVGTFGRFYAGTHLLRWSPLGDPVVPHVAKSYEVKDDGREYVFHLREGMRWSDGEPFTADDILYWWEHEINDPAVSTDARNIMLHRGELGTVEKVDDYTVRFRFEDPNGLFPQLLATISGRDLTGSPEHYLRPYHPRLGDPDRIEEGMRRWQMPTREALYQTLKEWDNPEHPRLWPFIYRSYQGDPPFVWVRNPYYFAVDSAGKQLPYLDRIVFSVQSEDLIPIAAANGDFSFQSNVGLEYYTILKEQQEANDYEVYYYSYGGGSSATIFPNLNKREAADQVNETEKRELMRTKEFRQALSLAINREAIIEVEYLGMTEPAQVAPGRGSPYFNEDLYRAYVEYDPERANTMLDGIGLTERDIEGYRTLPDGRPLTFTFTYRPGVPFTAGMAESIAEDWSDIGIRMIFRERGTSLAYLEREGMLHDFLVDMVNGLDYPIVNPRMFVPSMGTHFAQEWGYWFMRGGYYGVEGQGVSQLDPPPDDHPLMDSIRIYDRIIQETDPSEQIRMFQEILDIAAENVWTINISSPPPLLMTVKNGFRNVPRQAYWSWNFLGPSNLGYETFFWENPEMAPGAAAQVKAALTRPLGTFQASAATADVADAGSDGWRYSRMGMIAVFLVGLVFTGIRFPYIGRRLLLMIPSLFIISLLIFTIIQLPPGDYSTTLIAQAEAMGEAADMQRVEEMKEMFLLDEGWLTRYLSWSGLKWFVTYQNEDRGLLQGFLGRSMETLEPVNAIVQERFQLTVLIGLGTVMFTWIVALPIGIFSAVKQYSVGDYVFTFIGFLGMCIPNFLFALLLMYFSSTYFGVSVTGLFSPEYALQPEWTMGKFIDLMKHIWVPILVIGTAGTAGMIRVMRSNLLDELRKPYVTTARAKGLRPLRLVLKYPVRLALNPFISGLGHIFPQLISGGAIVALILSLPTLGPLLLEALLVEDMYLAGSLLMLLSTLAIVGTLISDLLLMALDPRIRMEGGRR